MTTLLNYLYNLHVALSQLVNVLIGGDPDESVSGRIGKSLVAGGWAARVPWPAILRRHWLAAIETDEGGNSARGRRERI
ncbi:hypothetical protein [Pannonibacter sp. SL95]|uniref:hypothetical protein n=1 Tax=Pannonibacter sp. SL95 TaxID=2995153 RepID=UPI002276C7FD|nr:hypothetical protein [Pannonibacter sp. SL95]MCY1705249.1 hypothetical protein [Pannonibacter sp. SL95]